MKDYQNIKVKLLCITCGDSNFTLNEDKTFAKCNRCGKEHHGGYDELVELNQKAIEQKLNKTKQEIEKELKTMFHKSFKNNKNIKFN